MSAPTIVYRCPGQHFAHAGQTYDYAKAATKEELAQRLADGWHASLIEAVDAANGKAKPADHEQDDESAPSRAELEQMATDLGIKFDGRTSDQGLLRKINEALAE